MDYFNLKHFKETAGYDIDGVWYPRVTKIVDIKAKPALYRFYAEMNNFNEGEAVKKKSAGEGTLIHEIVEKIFIGEKPQIDPSVSPAIEAFLRFLEEKNIQVDSEHVEKRIVHFGGALCRNIGFVGFNRRQIRRFGHQNFASHLSGL